MMIQGTAYWAKIVGAPVPGYDKSQKEWTFDLAIDDDTVEKLTELGCKDQIRNKNDDRGNFITFKRRAVTREGEPAKPFFIVDNMKREWDGKTRIGNGSILNVKFAVNDITYQGKTRPKASAISIQVWKHVPYDNDEFPVNEDGAESWD